MRLLHTLLLLPLVATLALLVGCKSNTEPDSGVIEVRDMQLTHVGAEEATQALRKKLGDGARVTPNLRNNSVIVTGTMAQVERAGELLSEIDVPREPR